MVVKPYIIGDDLKPLVIKKGQVIKYDIKYGGEPDPEVVWELDGKQIKPDGEKYVNLSLSHLPNCNISKMFKSVASAHSLYKVFESTYRKNLAKIDVLTLLLKSYCDHHH